MRASQEINTPNNYRLTPAQRRLSAGSVGTAGLRKAANRSLLPPARKAEIAAAITGGLVILCVAAGLLA
ncbi:hypothetical protein QWY85_13955 [Neolewinella lacunae]|uniref:Uncharacterized protein n=1 Tax=Neolewinella lacunae TaxID=1517758 RepID=A0A923T631_9BACT|nr:hypothetical protein [Neolewinella lacunae]MBC6992980.1 hypothetical protein [Neolewinella lacunae]MDN3635769.1 hypothetical protein [Neolewinella lacunae]